MYLLIFRETVFVTRMELMKSTANTRRVDVILSSSPLELEDDYAETDTGSA